MCGERELESGALGRTDGSRVKFGHRFLTRGVSHSPVVGDRRAEGKRRGRTRRRVKGGGAGVGGHSLDGHGDAHKEVRRNLQRKWSWQPKRALGLVHSPM